MSLFAKGLLAFSTVGVIQEIPMANEATKLLISGAFSLGSVLIVELFKFLKGRKVTRKTKQTNVEESKPNKDHDNQSGQVALTADNL